MLLLAGTLPVDDDSVVVGPIAYDGAVLSVGDRPVPAEMMTLGATAMMAAASVTSRALGADPPMGVMSGDLGDGRGSRRVYRFLADRAGEIGASAVTVHYILPLRQEFMDFVEMVDYWEKRPFLIADAGAMLIAKATGLCDKFDLFTPDAGEMAFLADPDAGHPAYVRAVLFDRDTVNVPELVSLAYSARNAPRYLAIKGPVDFVVDNGKIAYTVDQPEVPALEAVGGTGDTVTGIISALIASGTEPTRASLVALRANRLAGRLCSATPATGVFEMVKSIGEAVTTVMDAL
ncbi:MAG: sugar kinase [Nitrososphaerota archaeon]|nr:sugar kinase [Nitrososphaerota archaeon]MDG7023292.1 sugar kinase [Nitrososphaerota archaeon]